MGIGPKDMKANDKAVILFGGKTPYIIREQTLPESEDKNPLGNALDGVLCHLVGECYIDGMMYGEMMERKDREELFYNIW